ncbi:glycosyl hydrolase family 18 protein [Kribbella sandramycini]|uniref:GH18 family chitinase n=1 Tax=Kribbella sandramycini TaxID=60450 RepID=A0A841SSR3_9ACTN|nr:glycosyl hydrolase family 18 protein [Kribbella sandramycini]MBB6571036.1 GH18 family chitinase [Kribbella sandramycini]
MGSPRSRTLRRRKPPAFLIAIVTAIAVLVSSTGIQPATAAPDAVFVPAAGQDHTVRHDFQDPALAAHYVQQFDEIRASGKKLSQVVDERTKGQLHDVMPKLRFVEFDAELRVEGTVAVIVIKDPGVVVDESWWQGALIVSGAMLVGAGATALCLTYGGGVPLCAGLGGFIGEFVNGALTQWANGELGNADEWAKTMAKSIAAGLTGFLIAFAGTAEALAWYKATSASLVRFVRTVEAFFGGTTAGDTLASMLDALERYLPSYLRNSASATGVCREPVGEPEPGGGWTPLGQIVFAADGAQTRFMDVDGDLDVDRAISVNGRLYTWHNAGCGLDGSRVWIPRGNTAPGGVSNVAYFGDLDGDGKDDLVNFLTAAESPTGFAAMRVWRNESSGSTVRWANPVIVANDLSYVGIPVFADLDGDKDDDLIIPDRMGFVIAWENRKSAGLPKPGDWRRITGFTHPAEGRVGTVSYPDINGDLRADVVVVKYMTGDVEAWQNLGTGWEEAKSSKAAAADPWKSLGVIRSGNAFGGTVGDFGDLDADKVSDFLLFNSTSKGVDGWLLPSEVAAGANGGVGDPMEAHPGGDDGGARPTPSGDCRPDGLATTPGVATPYCKVYQGDGREWLGQGRDRRVVAYFNGARTGADGTPHYLVKNIPWSKVTHINYAFATVANNRMSVDAAATQMEWPGKFGAEMDPGLPYKGHFNLLTKYKRLHPRVKTLISVGGWAGSGGFYAMTTNADGSVNQAGIDTFSASAVEFLRTYGFDGLDIDFEYPTVLDDTGNPSDWATANPRRKGLPTSYTALMKTLRDALNRASVADNKYYLLTSASSASGYLVRGMANQTALDYQDFTNLMSYDYHGTWNDVVGPNAALFDDGKDPELAEQYATPEYGGIGYFNTNWAMKYMRGALQAGRVNLGVPYYTRGWKNVTGGTNGLWGKSAKPDGCEPGTGIKRPCGDGAVGIDNIWHDNTSNGGELGSGTNPLWHTKNLEKNILPRYAPNVGLDPAKPEDKLTGTYTRHWDNVTKTSWLWNNDKKVFLSTEDEQGIDAITDLVKSTGAGGVMMWELGGDFACPAVVDAQRSCGMGYTLTTRLNDKLNGAGAYNNSLRAGSTGAAPTATANISVDMVNYPTATANLWPLQPTVRITNNTGRTLGGGKDTKLSFDIPASTSPLVKDVNWQTGDQGGQWKLTAGSTFHRISTTLDYCQIIPAGKSLDLPIIYFLPITGPVNTSLSIGSASYAPITDNLKGLPGATPPAGGCSAGNWDATKIYDPATQPVEQVTVKYNNKIWKAKWQTQNSAPGTGPDPDHEPWKLIGNAS